MKSKVSENIADKGGYKILSIDYRLFYGLMLLCCLYLFINPVLKLIGSIAIICIFLLCFNDILLRSKKIKINQIWIWFGCFIAYNIIILIKTPTISAAYSCALQIALLLPICLYSSVSLKESVIKSIFKGGKIIFFILLIPAFIIIFKGGSNVIRIFSDYFSFTIYKIMFPCTFFFIAKSRKKLFKIIIFSFLFLAIGERTVFLCLYIIYFTYLLLGQIKHSKFIYKTFFKFLCLCSVVFPYVYVKLQYTDLGYWLNNMARQYTGGNFFSGRNRIWEIALDYFSQAPFLGYGMDNNILALNEISLSTHNLYVYLLLQGGILGLIVFMLFMYSIWKNYFFGLNDDIVRMSAAYFIGIMVFASFELILVVNAVTISLFLWLVIGIGLIQKNNIKAKLYSNRI